MASSASVSGAVVLRPRDNAALVHFIGEVTDKSSPLFHQYLPAGAFASRFGPTKAVIEAVRAQLQAHGLLVGQVSSDGMLLRFAGSAAQVEDAFHTQLESFRLADGAAGHATTSSVAVPSTIAGSVVAVVGLDNLVHEQRLGMAAPPALGQRKFEATKSKPLAHPLGSPTPCAEAQADAQSNGGLTDDQIAHAYGAFGLYGAGDLGAGQHIALYELEPILPSDIRTFDTCYFGTARAASMLKRLKVIPVDGGQPTGPGSGEALLDVEDLSAIAPGASIDVYVGPTPDADPNVYDALDEYAAIIDRDRDQVVSTSWGLCEQAVQRGQPGLQEAENDLFEQAAAQGQTVFAAAGDNGSDDCTPTLESASTLTPASGENPLSVDDPASQPYVVGVGGTTIDDAVSQPPLEHVWNDAAAEGAGGGGISMSWEMPAWQLSSRIPGLALPGSDDYRNANTVEQEFGYPSNFCQAFVPNATPGAPCRLVPDVSAQADDFTGAITVYSTLFAEPSAPDGWTTTGGTSSAAPTWAALLALVNASPTCADQAATRDGVGFVSPLLYEVASNRSDYAASFNDITTGNNDIYGLRDGLVFPAGAGYDLASGLGSPQLTGANGTAGLAFYLCSVAAQASRPVISRLSPASGPTAGGEKVTITGNGFESGGKSSVASLQVGSRQLPADRFRVHGATSITVRLPPARDTLPPSLPASQDGAGPADVIVRLKNGEPSSSSPSSTFQYTDDQRSRTIPSITGVSPDGGLEAARGNVVILGSGFTGATKVTFGGVKAPSFAVNSPYRITVTRPRYSSHTSCGRLPSRGVFAGEDARNDICQVEVRVSNAYGSSATGYIRPPLEGAIVTNSMGDIKPPSDCRCEVAQAPNEFDYLPRPTVSSISTSFGPANLASETGGTLITVRGTGLNPLTIEWADVGDPTLESSVDTDYVFLTGTKMQIIAPSESVTTDRVALPFSVRTLAGQARSSAVIYAGIPTVTAVVNTVNHAQLGGTYGGPDTGRTPIDISGRGFARQLLYIQFIDHSQSEFSVGTQYQFTTGGDQGLSTQTVQENPATVDVQLCTVTGCNLSSPADLFVLYPPGEPEVDSVSPTSGPAAGGTETVIGGQNLGCPLNVFFGAVQAASFAPVQALLDCGSTTSVDATPPPGAAGTTVPVTVTTLESYFTGSGPSPTTASFTYK